MIPPPPTRYAEHPPHAQRPAISSPFEDSWCSFLEPHYGEQVQKSRGRACQPSQRRACAMSPATPSTAASTSVGGGGWPAAARELCGLEVGEVADLHQEAAVLRVENCALAEQHWLLCTEVESVADELRERLRFALHANAAGNQRLSLEQASLIGQWYLDVSDRLTSLTAFARKADDPQSYVGATPPRTSLARVYASRQK